MRGIIFLTCAFSLSAFAPPSPELKTLYDRRQWFQLRESVLAIPDAPLFYRAAVAAAFHEDVAAGRMLRDVLRLSPRSWEAAEAKRLRGRLQARARSHQPIGKPRASRLRYEINQGLIQVPLAINGIKVAYVLDTGATSSVLSESEARRLHVRLHKSGATIFDGATGNGIPMKHYGIARRLSIGNTELRDVVFLVFPDDTFFFKNRKPGENGILGLAAIQALGTIQLDSEGNFDIGVPSVPSNPPKPNLVFDDERLATEVEFETQRLTFALDTGAAESNLWLPFRTRFPELVAAAAKAEKRSGSGASGMIEYDALVFPELKLRAGGLETLLRPAQIMLKENLGWTYHGNLGLDLLLQARTITLDFNTMQLALERR